MNLENITLALLILGTIVSWIVIYRSQFKFKPLLVVLAIPFGWAGLVYAFVKIVDLVFELIINDNNK